MRIFETAVRRLDLLVWIYVNVHLNRITREKEFGKEIFLNIQNEISNKWSRDFWEINLCILSS